MIPVALPPRVASDGLQDPCPYSVEYSMLFILPDYYKYCDVASQEITCWSLPLEYTSEAEYKLFITIWGLTGIKPEALLPYNT